MKAELVNETLPACDLGEGPHWDAAESKLYWVDITGKTIHRFDPSSGKHDTCATASTVGFAAKDAGGKLVAGLQDGLYRIDFETGAAESLARPHYTDADNRFNDGKCDRRGRLWAGTMNHLDHDKKSGALYRLDGRGLHTQETHVRISNGLGWSPDNKFMYYSDTRNRVIWRYIYDIESGTASNRTVFADFSKTRSNPDGLCVDAAGKVYSAQWPGWRIDIFAPDGKLEGKIELPVPQVSCCAFGGADLKTLYITTAAVSLSPEKLAAAPLSGKIFAVAMPEAGLAETPFGF